MRVLSSNDLADSGNFKMSKWQYYNKEFIPNLNIRINKL